MIKKLLVPFLILTFAVVAEGINFDIYAGYQNGNWRIRDTEVKESYEKGGYNFRVEASKMLYPHMHFILGTGYETGYTLKDSSTYDLIPLYLGGRFEYNEEAKYNPYVVGRIGYPIFTSVEGIDLNDELYNGWAQLGGGILINNKFFVEISYKQHITNYTVNKHDFDGRFFSIDFGYRIK